MTLRPGKRRLLLALFLAGAVLFGVLGIWQLERLVWKRDLIARVEARIHAAPVPAPGASRWATLELRNAEYQRVKARGDFQHEQETLVDALTELGPGSWVMTPLKTADGAILVNRGFVTPERRDPRSRAAGQVAGEVEVRGLLRLPEPGGRMLRPNAPDANRWYSRDVMAIARARGLERVAPYFIDAEANPSITAPVGGLTVVRFRNAHLVYALTWFALMGTCIAGLLLLGKERS